MSDRLLLGASFGLSMLIHAALLDSVGYSFFRAGMSGKSVLQVVSLPAANSSAISELSVLHGAHSEQILSGVEERGWGGRTDAHGANVTNTPDLASFVPLSIDDYLPTTLLDRPPKPRTAIDTKVNFRGMVGLVGEVELMLLISSSGRVDEVLNLGASLPDFIVEEAVARFKGVEFAPGMLAGVEVRSRMRIRLSPPSRDELLGNPYSAKERFMR